MDQNNGVGTPQTQNLNVAPQNGQVNSQPVVQPNSIGGTQYQVVNPGNPQPQQQQVQQTQQQIDGLQSLRQELANAAGVPIEQVTSDPRQLTQFIMGGLAAHAELQKVKQQQAQPQAQQTQQTQNGQQQLQLQQMPPGWEGMVTRNQQGVWEPNHPALAHVAQLANQNFAVQQMRQSTVQAGNFLPEHEQKIESIVEARLNERLEAQRQNDFINQHGQELFQHDANGQRVLNYNPLTQKNEPVMSEFGQAFNAAADELMATGAKFPSQHTLAQLAYKLAKERMKPQQQTNGQQNGRNGGPPSRTINPDLETLFTNHNTNGMRGAPNVNGATQMTGNASHDFRTNLRNLFANAPANASGVEYARHLGFNV